MKPSVILYKSLPDDLLTRLQNHFEVTELDSINAESQAKHAQLFANAVGLLGSSQNVDAALLEKCRSCAPPRPFQWATTTLTSTR